MFFVVRAVTKNYENSFMEDDKHDGQPHKVILMHFGLLWLANELPQNGELFSKLSTFELFYMVRCSH